MATKRNPSDQDSCSPSTERAKDPKRQAAGRRSRNKGKEFERKIARDLRRIFDPPELLKAIEAADNHTRKSAMVGTRVRRGEQGRNAHEPDVIAPCEWWMELQTTDGITPERKLEQAERDLAVYLNRTGERRWQRAVAICHQKAARSIVACMRLYELLQGCGGGFPVGAEWAKAMPVRIDYDEFLKMLEHRERAEKRYAHAG